MSYLSYLYLLSYLNQSQQSIPQANPTRHQPPQKQRITKVAVLSFQHHMKSSVRLYLGLSCLSHGTGRNENIDLGQKRGDSPLSQQPHLHIDQEVSGLSDLSVQVDSAGVAVEFAGAEVALVVALGDSDDDVVPSVSGRRAYSKDLRRDDDVGLEAQLVVGDAHWGVVTVQRVRRAADPLTAPGKERHVRIYNGKSTFKMTMVYSVE